MHNRPILQIDNLFSYEKDKDFRKFFYIACEGHKTEKKYFEKLKENISQVHPLEIVSRVAKEKGNSAPKHVLNCILKKKKTTDYRSIDTFWAVIDNEWGDYRELINEFKKHEINLIISSPCFEIWILLHHLKSLKEISCNGDESCSDITNILKDYFPGFNKNRPLKDNPMRFLRNANELAKELYSQYLANGRGVWTTMHLLIDELIK